MKTPITIVTSLILLTGCSRPNLETLNTTIHTVDVVPNWSTTTSRSGGTSVLTATVEEVTVFCDISVTVNNVDGTVGVRYSRQPTHALVERSEEVIEQNFPHLGDVELKDGDPLAPRNESAKDRCSRRTVEIQREIDVIVAKNAQNALEAEKSRIIAWEKNQQARLAEKAREHAAAEEHRAIVEKQKKEWEGTAEEAKYQRLLKEQRERRQRILDEAQRLRREREQAVRNLKGTP